MELVRLLYFIVLSNRVVIAALCTATFFKIYCAPSNYRYYKDVNMPIKVCSEAYFFTFDVV
jgi:hypothetical protein